MDDIDGNAIDIVGSTINPGRRRPRHTPEAIMKDGIHPEYKEVLFIDPSADFQFVTRSTMDVKNREKAKHTDGKEYPVMRLDVSSESHPFYTGKQKIVDVAGRVEKFKQRYGAKKPLAAAAPATPATPPAAA